MNLFLYSMILGGAVIAGGCIVLAASWYDLRATAQRARLTAAVRRLRRVHQPQVAILIDTRNASAADLNTSLGSVVKSRYQRLSICVVGARPTPALKQCVADYSMHYPALSLRYYAPRRPLSLTNAFRLAYRRLPKHDHVFILSAGNVIQPMTIKRAMAHFNINPRLGALTLAHRSHVRYNLASLLLHYEEASTELLQKAAPHLLHHTLSRVQTGTFYRHDYFLARKQQPTYRTHFESSLTIANRPTVLTSTPRYAIIIWLLSAVAIYLLTYAFIVAATLQSNSLLSLTWISLCAWTLTALWLEAAPLPEKITLTYGILLAPLLIYFRAALQVVLLPARALHRLVRQWHRTRYNTYRDRYQRYVLDNILAFKTWYEEMCPRELWYQDQRRADD